MLFYFMMTEFYIYIYIYIYDDGIFTEVEILHDYLDSELMLILS